MLAHVVSAPDSSLGSVGTMEKEWRDADAHEVTSREGRKGVAPMELFFFDFRALLTASATEVDNRLKRCEKVAKSVNDKRDDLYNKLVASYHRAKTERAEMARELEAAQAIAAQVPQLQEELQLSCAQCTASQETAKALAAQAKETEGELARLPRLEANHLAELEAVKRVEQERVDSLNQCLGEVDEQRQKLSSDMAAQSKVLSDTAKRWLEEISMLDRSLVVVNLVKWLENAPDRLLEWKESTARAGADMALSFVLSWYEEVSLDQLESRRAGVEDTLSAENKTRRLARACAIADYVNHNIFVNDPNLPEEGPGEEEEMADAEETTVPEADPASGLGAPPIGPSPAGA
ncbi:hypothetical protein ACQ4PT_000466 [Festuca glaucescens]